MCDATMVSNAFQKRNVNEHEHNKDNLQSNSKKMRVLEVFEGRKKWHCAFVDIVSFFWVLPKQMKYLSSNSLSFEVCSRCFGYVYMWVVSFAGVCGKQTEGPTLPSTQMYRMCCCAFPKKLGNLMSTFGFLV